MLMLYAFLSFLAIGFAWDRSRRRSSRLPFPPGPKPLPLLGNLGQFPLKEPAKAFAKWKELYGDMIYINDINGPVLVLNSHKAGMDLLDRRSAIYSDRPITPMFELSGHNWVLSMIPYTERWRQHRRLFHQFFNEKASNTYREIQEQSTHSFLNRLLQDPDKFLEHIRINFANTILRIVYDIKVEHYDDVLVDLAERVMKSAVDSLTPGVYAVNHFPFLQYLPSWFPGGGFKKEAEAAKVASRKLRELPIEQLERRSKDLGSGANVWQLMLEKCESKDNQVEGTRLTTETALNSAGVAYLAGADTTLSSIQALFMALANYPDVQKRAQAELDAVIGCDRLPTFTDMQDLPYVAAVVKEILRWHNVLPFGIVHRLTEDDIYDGYFIPKGTGVFLNTWAVLHDPETYPDPHTFNPSRWLLETPEGLKINDAIPDPDIAAFGAGRRICPGRHLARNALFIIVSSVTACFNITPLDAAGKPAEKVPEDMTDGILVYPLPFKVSIVPRSERAARLINETTF